jgi:hypothetical protein
MVLPQYETKVLSRYIMYNFSLDESNFASHSLCQLNGKKALEIPDKMPHLAEKRTNVPC